MIFPAAFAVGVRPDSGPALIFITLPNVFQTGQNINSHGMLGVLVGALVTCRELVPQDTLSRQIWEAQ